jgi:cytochrome c-type biogenesis protein CcmH/NrfG
MNRLTKAEINTLKKASSVEIKNSLCDGVTCYQIVLNGSYVLTPVYWTVGTLRRAVSRIRQDIDLSFHLD